MNSQNISKPGDIWLLGKHRLMCGDSTQIDDLKKLMGKEKADLVFTDPPYNVNYQGRNVKQAQIKNDHLLKKEFRHFLRQVFISCQNVMKQHASMYVCHGFSSQYILQNILKQCGFNIRNQIVWVKNHFVISWGRYKYQHELLFYCHLKKQRDVWYGDKKQNTIWQFPKPLKNKLHPTMKPIPLVEKALKNSSQVNDVVLDLFGGSGTTLIACEQQKRRAYLMELEPHYCDIIIERWQMLTGKQATLHQSNRNFDAFKNSFQKIKSPLHFFKEISI